MLLLGVASSVLVSAGMLDALASLADSPESTADTVLAVVTSPQVRHATASALVDQLAKDEGGTTQRVIIQHRAQLVVLAERAIASPAVREIARHDLIRIYRAVSAGNGMTIDLRPLFYEFTAAMHRVVVRIAPRPTGLHNAVLTIRRGRVALHLTTSLFALVLLLVALGTLEATVTTVRLVRRTRWRYWALGGALGVPALELMVLGRAGPSIVDHLSIRNPNAKAIAHEAATRAARAVSEAGYLLALATVVGLGAFTLGLRVRAARVR